MAPRSLPGQSPGRVNGRLQLRAWVPSTATLVMIGLTVSLGQWQLDRAEQKRGEQARLDEAARLPAINWAEGRHGEAGLDTGALIGRRLIVQGRFDERRSVFIDNRTHKGIAGFHVLTPLIIPGDSRAVLVLRGWVAGDPARRGRTPVAETPQGDVQVRGFVLKELAQVLELKASPEPAAQDSLWQNATVSRVARWSGLDLYPMVLRQDAELESLQAEGRLRDGLVRDWPNPGTGVDKHLAYAAQWFGLALLCAILWISWQIRRRRKL